MATKAQRHIRALEHQLGCTLHTSCLKACSVITAILAFLVSLWPWPSCLAGFKTNMNKIAIFLIVFYQKCLSPLNPPTCRFYPSCSDYARQSIQKKGLRRGGWQAAKRLLRCHPLSPGGYDPVK